MEYDRKKFFDRIRTDLFKKLNAEQVTGINRWLDLWESRPDLTDVRWFAYILATDYWETGRRMIPVREIGKGKGRVYGQLHAPVMSGSKDRVPNNHIYYGRGDVQLTWYDNYFRMQRLTGWPLVDQPDAALDPAISAEITTEGMTHGSSSRGDFTGKSLEDYFNKSKSDPVNARRIINGTDKAKQIAAIYVHFLNALNEARLSKPTKSHDLPIPSLPALPSEKEQDEAVHVEPIPAPGAPKTVGGTGAGSITAVIASGYNKWIIIAAVVAFVIVVAVHVVKAHKKTYVRQPELKEQA